jgi:hypothetical protein
VALTTGELLSELRELIDALDRRVPHIERAGEAAIAHDADELRRRAMERLAQLEAQQRDEPAASRAAVPRNAPGMGV